MDFTPLLGQPFLGPAFPLPLDRPFTTAEARYEAGLSYRDLKWLVDEGFLRHPVKGVYVAAQLGDSTSLRVQCLRLVVPEDAVVCDRHAGWLHGAEMALAPNEHVNVMPICVFLPPGRRLRNELTDGGERKLEPSDITEVDGLLVTTPIRTTWDLGRTRWTDRSIAGMDQMLRLGVFSKEELLAGIERFRGMRWVTVLRVVAPHTDGRAESPPESVLRLRWIETYLPAPIPQFEVWSAGEFLARLDLANEQLRYAAEYDGAEWHSSPGQLEHDRLRRALVREQEGWHITPFTKENLFGPHQDADRVLRREIAEAGRRIRRTGA